MCVRQPCNFLSDPIAIALITNEFFGVDDEVRRIISVVTVLFHFEEFLVKLAVTLQPFVYFASALLVTSNGVMAHDETVSATVLLSFPR